MRVIFSYFRLITFISGLLIGVQVPHFVDQYGKALQSLWLESEQALSEFQQEADRYFDGDMEKLIAYYRKSDDQVFIDGGDSISAIYQRNQQLKQALANYRQGLKESYWHTFVHPQADIRQEVMQSYTYAIQLTPHAMAVGVILALLLAVLTESLLRLLLLPWRKKKRGVKHG